MNEYDIEQALQRWPNHPVLGPAARTLDNLRRAANRNSDGWGYWPKPTRAAAQLIELIQRDGTGRYAFDNEREDATVEEYTAALRPIRAFRTRNGIAFEIVEAGSVGSVNSPLESEQMSLEFRTEGHDRNLHAISEDQAGGVMSGTGTDIHQMEIQVKVADEQRLVITGLNDGVNPEWRWHARLGSQDLEVDVFQEGYGEVEEEPGLEPVFDADHWGTAEPTEPPEAGPGMGRDAERQW